MMKDSAPYTLHPTPYTLHTAPVTIEHTRAVLLHPDQSSCNHMNTASGVEEGRGLIPDLKPALTISCISAYVCMSRARVCVCVCVCVLFHVNRIEPSDAQARRHAAAGCQLQDSTSRSPRRAGRGMDMAVVVGRKAASAQLGTAWLGGVVAKGKPRASWVSVVIRRDPKTSADFSGTRLRHTPET